MSTFSSILKQHSTSGPTTDSAEENIEDCGGWGLLRGVRDRALALELRQKSGDIMALPYALVEAFLYSPADGITLRAGGREVRIRGRHLAGPSMQPLNLFAALARHRVPYIAEHSRADRPTSSDQTIIDSIIW